MYAKGQREVVVFGYALIIAALVCVVGYVSSSGCGRTSADTARGNGERAAEQVKRAAELNRQAGIKVESAAGAVGRAEQHADKAEQLNQSAQAGIDDCQKLVSELKADNRRAKQLVDELIREAESGCTQGEKN